MGTVEALKREIDILRCQLKTSEDEIEKLKKLNQCYIEQLRLNRQKKYGISSEKTEYDSEQLSFFNEAEASVEMINPEPTAEAILIKARKKGSRKTTTELLPAQIIEYQLEECEQICSKCHSPLHVMKKNVRQEIRIIPAQVKLVEHVTYVYACRACEKEGIKGNIVLAKSPKALIPKSFVSPSLMAHIMCQKYVNSLPLDRQAKDFTRFDITLSKQTLSNWVLNGAKLLEPLGARLKTELLQNQVLHADETVLEVLCEPGREAQTNSYMWVYRTSGDAQKQVVLYDYTEGRSGEHAQKYLAGFCGYLHADGFAGYHRLEPQVTLCGCFSHLRRKFDEALKVLPTNMREGSLEAVGRSILNKLFALEKEMEGWGFPEKQACRQDKSKKIIEKFYTYVDEHAAKTLPQSLLGKAFTYAQRQKQYLLSFLKDGRIELSNNRAERSIKPFVIGRKNWLFCNTPRGANASAIIYSLVQTAIENGLKPMAYLQYVFEQIQLGQAEDIDALLPWSEQIPPDCKLK